ncbi:hypothetical protein TPA0907_57240 [Micromonospora humidisoli]|nr:hypothetical protein TPA0907_57240 [Micromonospora sp. AKA109]
MPVLPVTTTVDLTGVRRGRIAWAADPDEAIYSFADDQVGSMSDRSRRPVVEVSVMRGSGAGHAGSPPRMRGRIGEGPVREDGPAVARPAVAASSDQLAVQDRICGLALLLPFIIVVKPKVLPLPLERIVIT